jgi:hypothetical protein
MTTVISVLSRQGPRWHDDGAPKDGRVPAWVMVGEGQEPRSRVVPRLANQSSPGLLPMVVTAGLPCDQEGKEGGSSLFILRKRRAVGFGRGGDVQEGLGRCGV